jgi:hypothetical protein
MPSACGASSMYIEFLNNNNYIKTEKDYHWIT